MSLTSLAGWLRCPKCFADLEPTAALVLGCASGHRYDANKRGFVSLLAAGSGKFIGDSATMLDARNAFLDAGWYEPILQALRELHEPREGERLIDAGCGTGYYLRGVSNGPEASAALAFDLSPAAVAMTARSSQHVDGLVADVWRPLPIRTAAAETLLNVFAPRNPEEFARILVPGGDLLTVVPGAGHLLELREAGLALEVPEGKSEQLTATLSPFFSLVASTSVTFRMALDVDAVEQLLGMGPSAHHRAVSTQTTGFDQVTASVEVLRFRRRPN